MFSACRCSCWSFPCAWVYLFMKENVIFQLSVVNNSRKDGALRFRGVCEVLRCERKSSLPRFPCCCSRIWVGKCCSWVVVIVPAWVCSNSKKRLWSFTKKFKQKNPSQSECVTWVGLLCLPLSCCCSFTFQGLTCLGDPFSAALHRWEYLRHIAPSIGCLLD